MDQLSFDDLETWKPVFEYEDLYLVTNHGRVRSLPRNTTSGKILKLIPDKHGYFYVGLTKDGVQKRRPVHQLVMEAFDKPCPPGMEVRHLDGNPANNRWAPGSTEQETRAAGGNLFYGTHAKNMQDKREHGTDPNTAKTYCPKKHEYTPENTRILGSGSRACKECARDKSREYMRGKYVPRDPRKVCPVCEREFTRQPGQSGNRKYCSDECSTEARSAKMREARRVALPLRVLASDQVQAAR